MSQKYSVNSKMQAKNSIILALMMSLCSCSSIRTIKVEEKKEKEILVRVTTYSKKDDHFTRRGLTSTGAKLINKGSVAVDPAIIPYFSTVKIPEAGIEAIANDTGSAVVSRKAAKQQGQDVPVVDLFFDKKKDAMYFADNNPMFMTAIISL